ncbi:alkaline phosphatase [Macrolepiota fuliginosa MF-IS2]|uniref:alkaline phosphatase n=1 Tax=Macrolepiota fuliginosa MF-IS2 TaxID=1400762 RepID=A0A9P6C572_9AGAR|nr:alkaline phosphatase [Macrolepiota fuliginosa MF-IS2]
MRPLQVHTLFLLGLLTTAAAQHFKRLGTCPTLGCILPPDQTDFYPGQLFDVRVEVHAPINGSEASNKGVPDEKFSFCVQSGKNGACQDAAKFFGVHEPALEKWSFTYFEDLFAQDANQPTLVNVASKVYRGINLKKAGEYTATLKYNGRSETVASWVVRSSSRKQTAKNVLFFIGDGMTQSMITAARLIGHKSINGRYQSLMQLDRMDANGIQMTHSIDSFITDSANSATALFTGKKSSVSALNVWADSSPNSFDDPKMETIAELFRRRRKGGALGIVSTAFIGDATPASLCAHTRNRNEEGAVIFEYLESPEAINKTFTWPTNCEQPDVILGGGAEAFLADQVAWQGQDMYKAYRQKGYNVLFTGKDLNAANPKDRTLGIFCTNNMAKWVDRNIIPGNLRNQSNSPTGDGTDAVDQPGLKEMTLKAIDILQARADKNAGWFMMSEAASIDKMMHVLDYDRALGELLELDDTISATMDHLKKIGELDNTLIVVTADHGHGFDVFGSADTKYLTQQSTNILKRRAVGTYEASGSSEFQVAPGARPDNATIVVGPQGPSFPVQWDPRYKLAAGFGANPDHRENYKLTDSGPRLPAVGMGGIFVTNPDDNTDGFDVSGTLGGDEAQGVHSLTDVSIFASGPGAEAFRGVYNNIDIFYKVADAMGLGA